MMQGYQMSGSAETGYGLTVSGFHCPVMQFGSELQTLLERTTGEVVDVVQFEDNGYSTLLLLSSDGRPADLSGLTRIASYRREPHRFFQDLPKAISPLKIKQVLKLSLSGSLGSLQLILLYRAMA